MKIDKSLLAGSTTMLLLKLLDAKDMYGYEMIEELDKRSDSTFELKAGTLYPILHTLEQKNMVTAYEEMAENKRLRKYYHITKDGKKYLKEKQEEWKTYSNAVNKTLGGMTYAEI